jgi:hypothetical protein
MIVIGLGSGRCGTASLAKLLNAQTDALCFHEMNPSCVRFTGTPRPILNTIDEFQEIIDGGDPSALTVDLARPVAANTYDQLCRMDRVQTIGDIAFYYLSYVEAIATRNANVRFVCLKRDKEETVESWMKKTSIHRWHSKKVADRLAAWITRGAYHQGINPWMEHDGTIWMQDLVWDKCFPKFSASSKREAVSKYWDFYYGEADRLVGRLGNVFRIVETNRLSDRSFQRGLLTFCGVELQSHVYTDAHIHQSKRQERAKYRAEC